MTRQAKLALLAVAVAAAAALLVRVRGALTPFLLASVIAYVSHPAVKLLEARQVPRPLAILLVYVALGLLFLLPAMAVVPRLAAEIDLVLAKLPEQTRRLERVTESVAFDLGRLRLPGGLEDAYMIVIGRVERLLEEFAARLASAFVGLLSQVFSLILAPFLAYYMLRDAEALAQAATAWLPERPRQHVLELGRRISRVLAGFVRGQLIVSAAVGFAVAAGLSLLGVRYAAILGLFAGLADVIPYFGPLISAVPALALGLMESPLTALWVALLLVAVQQLEGSVLGPRIVGERVGLHPLTVILSVLVGGELLGVTGMFLAVPAAAALKTVAAYARELAAAAPGERGGFD